MVREFLAVLVRAALQWALASLLLANGAAFCLIAAAASSLRLGPPCLLCARVHRLLRSSSSSGEADCSQEEDTFRRLLCDAHVAAIARLGSEETEKRAGSRHVDTATRYDHSDKSGGLESHRVVSIGSEICEQDRGADDGQPRATNLSILGRTSSIDSGEGPYVSLFELAPLVALPEDTPPDYDAKEAPHGHGHGTTRKPEHRSASSSDAAGGEQALTVSGLVAALGAQRRELEAARAELHGERRARAELEEQGELDREAARVAMQLVHETETEKHELQRQLDAFRIKAQLYDYEAAGLDAGCSAPPANRLGRRLSRGSELMGLEDDAGWDGNKNYQSLVDFLPGSVYSSSPDLANLLRLYTEGNGNGARRPKEGDITEEEEEEVVVAVTAAAVSGFDGGDSGEASSIYTAAGASLPETESGGGHVRADLAQDEAAVMRA